MGVIKVNIGLIGCGTIGEFLIRHINEEQFDSELKVVAILDERKKHNPNFQMYKEKYGIKSYSNFNEFIDSDIDIVVETANINVVFQYAEDILKKGKRFLPVSIGAFADEAFFQRICQLAKKHHTEIIMPSGAIAGLDGIKAAASLGTIKTVEIKTTKPAQSLGEFDLHKPKVIYSGNAKEAIEKFPSNMNVSIVLSLAGIGSKETMVKVIADPHATENVHEITVDGSFGQFYFNVMNEPLPSNPKTSFLAALSVLSALKNLNQPFRII